MLTDASFAFKMLVNVDIITKNAVQDVTPQGPVLLCFLPHVFCVT